ncbi:flavodoxin domain-containing protein [Actinomycetospora lutea]|uniref:flavodoxin family protein n=1 Tax=Actinomycetospora lutea TaxID=663604 RepID=UPI002364FF5D|nr:flavodoxin domain-containing protein [Actinomycetospora lutea]MDD7939517.1 flavodoxin domain-containing protein [Actinomycetospora lutea]
MTRALVVFESMYGNTEAIARAIADGLATGVPVDVVEVGAAPSTPGDDVDLLVVGGPTHAFGMTRASTRRDAATKAEGALVSRGPGVREWLAALPARPGLRAAAFDTRVGHPRVPGSAARAIRRRLRRGGAIAVDGPHSFYVEGTDGPLSPGELERARAWGTALAAAAAVPAGGGS